MKKVNIIALGLVLLMAFSIIAGCSGIRYNAKLYDNAKEWINEEFISENLVGNSESGLPQKRTFIIKSLEEFNKVFVKNIGEIEVDFSKQMLVVYTFRDINARNNKLVKLALDGDVLKITCEMEKRPGIDDSCEPYQRWFVVILDKLDVSSVIFERK